MTELGLAGRVRRTAVRTLTAVGALAVTGAVAVAPLVVPGAEPVAPRAAELTPVEVPPAATALVCAGPLRLATEPEPGGDVAYDPQFDPSPEESAAALRAASVSPEPAGAPAEGEVHALADPGAVAARLRADGGGAAVADVEPDGALVVATGPARDVPSWSAGATAVTTRAGDLRGLAAASCQRPAADLWLVGGSTALGSSARLVLQNPGSTPATVRVELWGPAGPVELAGAPEYLVPPRSERAVLLEGVAAEQARIGLHLASSGGLVTAHLQDSALRGLVPAGVDQVVAGAPPARRQVVPGLVVAPSTIDGADTAAVRLLAPGDDGGTATLALLGADGPVELPGADSVELVAGEVLDVPLAGLPEGAYTVVVDAEVPVVAAALLTRGAAAGQPASGTPSRTPLERAWAPSVRPGVAGALALPAAVGGTAPTVVLGLPADPARGGPAGAELVVVDASGATLATREVTLRTGTTAALPVASLVAEAAGGAAADEPAAVVLRTEDPRVVWAIVLERPDPAGDLVSVLAPVAPARAQPEVRVQVG